MSESSISYDEKVLCSADHCISVSAITDKYEAFFLQDTTVICQVAQYVLKFINSPENVLAIKELITGYIRVNSYEKEKQYTFCDILSWATLTRETYEIDFPKMSQEAESEGHFFTPNSTIENIQLIESVVRQHGRWRDRTSQNTGRIQALADEAQKYVREQTPKQLETYRLAHLKKLENERGPIVPFTISVTQC